MAGSEPSYVNMTKCQPVELSWLRKTLQGLWMDPNIKDKISQRLEFRTIKDVSPNLIQKVFIS